MRSMLGAGADHSICPTGQRGPASARTAGEEGTRYPPAFTRVRPGIVLEVLL